MKLAAARAGGWFFGTIIFILLFMPSTVKDKSLAEGIVMLIFYGFIAGGAVFFWTWYKVVEEDRELEAQERRKALEDSGSGNQS